MSKQVAAAESSRTHLRQLVGGLLVIGAVIAVLLVGNGAGGAGLLMVSLALGALLRWAPVRPRATRLFVATASLVALALGVWRLLG